MAKKKDTLSKDEKKFVRILRHYKETGKKEDPEESQ